MQLRRARALRRLINCTHAIAMGTRILKLPVHKFMEPPRRSEPSEIVPTVDVCDAGGRGSIRRCASACERGITRGEGLGPL